MNEASFCLKVFLAVLATWRVTHLLAREDGPADIIVRFRTHLGSGILGKLMDCFHCLSLWVAAPLAFFVSQRPLDLLVTWLALSGAACLLERIGQQPVVIEPMSELRKGDEDYGMLRSETSGNEQESVVDGNHGTHTGRAE